MGGGGGFSNHNFTQKNEEQISSLNNYFSELLKQINSIDIDAVKTHISELLKKFENDQDINVVDINTEGSYSKHTYVNDLSDIDVLVSFGNYSNSTLPEKDSPSDMLSKLESLIRERLPNTDITKGDRAITINYSDKSQIQIIPSFSYHSGYKVPDDKTNTWTTSFPKKFKKELTQVNKNCGNKVIPTIKLVKELLSKTDIGLKSYHIENLAAKAFQHYDGSKSFDKMLSHLINDASKRVKTHMIDSSGQSKNVDNYLKGKREIISEKLMKLHNKIQSCSNIDDWKNLYICKK